MAGLAVALELLSKASSSLQPRSLHSFASLSAVSAATAAAATVGCYTTLASHVFSGGSLGYVVHCKEYKDSESWKVPSPAVEIVDKQLPDKSYDISLKPFFSAFSPKALATTILRALLLNFQPVLEAYVLLLKGEEDDNEDEEEEEEEEDETVLKPPVDYKAALKGSGRSILREVTVITTRRLLERIVIQCASKRVSWKLLKDLPKSSERKAARHMAKFQLLLGVTKTTFRGHFIAIAASWLVQLALDIYNCIRNLYRKRKKLTSIDGSSEKGQICAIEKEELVILWRRIVGNTLKCGASLVFASIGAGLGAVLIRPSSGQWIGCAVGELVGGVLMGFWIDSWIIFGTFDPPEVD